MFGAKLMKSQTPKSQIFWNKSVGKKKKSFWSLVLDNPDKVVCKDIHQEQLNERITNAK